jgi:hypothetical protein
MLPKDLPGHNTPCTPGENLSTRSSRSPGRAGVPRRRHRRSFQGRPGSSRPADPGATGLSTAFPPTAVENRVGQDSRRKSLLLKDLWQLGSLGATPGPATEIGFVSVADGLALPPLGSLGADCPSMVVGFVWRGQPTPRFLRPDRASRLDSLGASGDRPRTLATVGFARRPGPRRRSLGSLGADGPRSPIGTSIVIRIAKENCLILSIPGAGPFCHSA